MSETEIPKRILLMDTLQVNRYAFGLEREIAELKAALEAKDRTIVKLVEALSPFADAVQLLDHAKADMPAGSWVTRDQSESNLVPRIKHFRAAQLAIVHALSKASQT